VCATSTKNGRLDAALRSMNSIAFVADEIGQVARLLDPAAVLPQVG
jgi:hypothetical protein